MKRTTTLLAVLVTLTTLAAARPARAYEYRADSVLPALWTFLCDSLTQDQTIRDCPPPPQTPDPYGGGAAALVHWTHSWIQLFNESAQTFGADAGDELRLYLFDEHGQPATVNDSGCHYPVYSDASGTYIDLLADVLAGVRNNQLGPGETVFLYVHQCLNDGHPGVQPDDHPPTHGVIRVRKVTQTAVPTPYLWLHAGWEEGVLADMYGARYHTVKAGSLVDKERIYLRRY